MVRVNRYLRLREYLSSLPIARRLLAPRFAPGIRKLVRRVDRTVLRLYPAEVRLRHEFNLWAENGVGESMELDHLWVADKTLDRMALAPGQRILDLGCGDGWACRMIAERLGNHGQIVGLDISDEMVRRARTKSPEFLNLDFLCASADHIPCRDGLFNAVLSISAFYYFPDEEAVLNELYRVVAPDGKLFFATCLYKDLPDWNSSKDYLRIPVHVRSASEYKAMFSGSGWLDVDAQELRQADDPRGHDRALLITGRRPLRHS